VTNFLAHLTADELTARAKQIEAQIALTTNSKPIGREHAERLANALNWQRGALRDTLTALAALAA
jgi:hypothetical protein